MRRLLAPVPLTADHRVEAFTNGRHPALDRWLIEKARASEGKSARTYVLCAADTPLQVLGYATIAAGSVERQALPSARLRQAQPDPVPVLLLARLALDRSVQGQGLGTDLLNDALRRCLAAAAIIGARAVWTQPIDDAAVAFYRHHGFLPLAPAHGGLILPIELLLRSLAE